MQYTPKIPSGNVNVSKTRPLKECAKLLAGLAVLLTAFYILAGMAVELVVPVIPRGVERRIGNLLLPHLEKKIDTLADDRTEMLLSRLVSQLDKSGMEYDVQVLNSSKVNAAALPGGYIIVFKGLIDSVRSDNELAFVLAHELGHYAHRHHLKGIGRGFILTFGAALLGSDNALNDIIHYSLFASEMKFSQKQEKQADRFAVDLMVKAYGNAEGGIHFFERIKTENKVETFRYFFSTHPDPDARIEAIRKRIAQLEGKK